MVSQRDPARFGLFLAVGAPDIVAGALLVIGNLDQPLMSTIGGVLALVGLAMLARALRGYRREKSRVD